MSQAQNNKITETFKKFGKSSSFCVSSVLYQSGSMVLSFCKMQASYVTEKAFISSQDNDVVHIYLVLLAKITKIRLTGDE